MSRSCPLCGKTKPGEALFCDDCTRRVRDDYEINLPEERSVPKSSIPKSSIPERNIMEENVPKRSALEARVPEMRNTESVSDKDFPEKKPPEYDDLPIRQPEKKRLMKAPLLFLVVVILFGGSFWVYNEVVRKRNLERSGWEAAIKLNSTIGYIDYMETFPDGEHFDEAQAGLLRLKSEEAASWDQMKVSANTSELRDFLNHHPESPYAPLVQLRLDSLSWMGALRVNRLESYSGYLIQAQRGELRGDYISEASKRQEMLQQSFPVETATLDSIRSTVNGFYVSLSGSTHDGAYQYLAPVVRRFFSSGTASRERITGELLMSRTRARGATLSFVPGIDAIQYERAANGDYLVNLPLTKSYISDGATEQVPGYIVHMELNPEFQIVSIYETKPHPEAP